MRASLDADTHSTSVARGVVSPLHVVKEFLLVVRSGQDPDRASEFLAPRTRAHQVQSEAPLIVERSPAEYAEHVREMQCDYGDFSLSIDELFFGGDRVYARWPQRGHHLVEIEGAAPEGRPLKQIASAVYRLEDDRIVEYWIQIDRHGLRAQLLAPGG